MLWLIVTLFFLIVVFSFWLRKEKSKHQEDSTYLAYLSSFSGFQPMPPITTVVAGTRYTNPDGTDRQKIIQSAKVGERLMLLPEEQNLYDPDAVRVVRLNGELIGYLEMDLAMEIKSRLVRKLRVDASIQSISQSRPLEVTISLVRYSKKPPKPSSGRKK